MLRTTLVILGILALTAPVFASTTAQTCMNITVTVERFVMAAWGGNVSLTITQSEIEQHPGDARDAEALSVPGSLHIQTNFNCDAKLTVHPAINGTETIGTGLDPQTLTVDGNLITPVHGGLWWPGMEYYYGTASIDDIDLGPTASDEGGSEIAIPGRNYVFTFNVGAKNRTATGLIPSAGTYNGSFCVEMTPEEVETPG